MLALQHTQKNPQKCSPNLLPCRINHNGPCRVTKRFWSSTSEQGQPLTRRKRRHRTLSSAKGLPRWHQDGVLQGPETARQGGHASLWLSGYVKPAPPMFHATILFTLPSGVITTSSDRLLTNEPTKPRPGRFHESDEEDQEEEDDLEPIKILEETGIFDDMTVWGHDTVPTLDDPLVKGIEEWIAFAEAIHLQPSSTELPANTHDG